MRPPLPPLLPLLPTPLELERAGPSAATCNSVEEKLETTKGGGVWEEEEEEEEEEEGC